MDATQRPNDVILERAEFTLRKCHQVEAESAQARMGAEMMHREALCAAWSKMAERNGIASGTLVQASWNLDDLEEGPKAGVLIYLGFIYDQKERRAVPMVAEQAGDKAWPLTGAWEIERLEE